MMINRKNVTACDKCKFWLYKENLYKDKFSDRIRRVCLVHIYVWSSCVPKFDEASLGNVLFLETCCLNFLFLWQRVNEFVAILRENSRAIIRVLDKVKDTKILKPFFEKKVLRNCSFRQCKIVNKFALYFKILEDFCIKWFNIVNL